MHLIRSLGPDSGNQLRTRHQCPAGRGFQYRGGSGRVLDKIPGIGSGSGRVGVSKYANGYFRVSLLVSGIFRYFRYFGYFGYFRVFLGISGISGIFGYFGYLRVLMGINGYLQVYYISSLFWW